MESIVFLAAVALFVFFSFLRTWRFWKRVYDAPDIASLSAKDRAQYEREKTQWPHDKLALQKMFETKLMAVVFVAVVLLCAAVYYLVKFL